MSRDWDYILVWESLPYKGGPPAPLAKAWLEKCRSGEGTVIDDNTLHWRCSWPIWGAPTRAKHGLVREDFTFPILPDQVFERADGGLFEAREI
jgi:hypothetical protein